MKHILLLWIAFMMASSAISQNPKDEQLVKQTVKAWFNSFNKHNYNDFPDYTTEDCVGINPFGSFHQRTDETPQMFNKAHELFLRKLSIEVDVISTRFMKADIAIATIFSTQKGVLCLPPDGINEINVNNGKMITTMFIVKQNNKWLISQYQHTIIGSVEPK